MGGHVHLHAGDAEAVVDLIESSRESNPGLSFPEATFEGLRRLFPGCHFQYQVNDVIGRRRIWVHGMGPDGPLYEDGSGPDDIEEDRYFFDVIWQDPMCSLPLRTGDRRTILMTPDFFPTRRDMLNRPFTREFCPEIVSVLSICLPSLHGYERRISVGREEGRVFDERDRCVAELLRPHLQEIWLDAERRRVGAPALTPREWEVLALAASGLTHGQIAERLFLSESTVHKHMEHVRERVGVRTAAEAAALALPFAPVAHTPAHGQVSAAGSPEKRSVVHATSSGISGESASTSGT
ncbi:helix-turn-helix transcriptional regulator [Cellulomonas sp.]|uniref:helix-turn-helix transcriptional regulator n=1 Tax=Cellulomonas sp. TaxID=40001 RepID=UPI003BAB31F7